MSYSSTQGSTLNESRDSDSVNGGRQLNEKFFKDLFRKEWKMYYRTPELNEKLYLHYKGTFLHLSLRFHKDSEYGAIHRPEVPLFRRKR